MRLITKRGGWCSRLSIKMRMEAEIEANGGSQWHVTVLIENAGRVYIQYANDNDMCGASSSFFASSSSSSLWPRLSLIERSHELCSRINSLHNGAQRKQHLPIISLSCVPASTSVYYVGITSPPPPPSPYSPIIIMLTTIPSDLAWIASQFALNSFK